MRNNLRAMMLLVLTLAVFSTNAHAQYPDAHLSSEFLLEEKTHYAPGRDNWKPWHLCLRKYYVLLPEGEFHIPVFPVYSECCFENQEYRAVDVLERASNALDALLHAETLVVKRAPTNGNFRGSSIWTWPPNIKVEHPGLVFRIDEEDKSHFGLLAENPEHVAKYVKKIFYVMGTLFLDCSDPSDSPVVEDYPEVKILKRIWLDARQHVEKMNDVPADKSAEQVRPTDIQEAIDMLSESQRRRLLGIAVVIPVRR